MPLYKITGEQEMPVMSFCPPEGEKPTEYEGIKINDSAEDAEYTLVFPCYAQVISPEWTNDRVTDGCFMYRTAEGRLLMIWSNFDYNGNYCVGIAHSENGKIDGKLIQEQRLFSKELSGKYEGGHGMIFTGINGQKYLSVHSPNFPTEDGRKEQPIFIPAAEKNDTLVCL